MFWELSDYTLKVWVRNLTNGNIAWNLHINDNTIKIDDFGVEAAQNWASHRGRRGPLYYITGVWRLCVHLQCMYGTGVRRFYLCTSSCCDLSWDFPSPSACWIHPTWLKQKTSSQTIAVSMQEGKAKHYILTDTQWTWLVIWANNTQTAASSITLPVYTISSNCFLFRDTLTADTF